MQMEPCYKMTANNLTEKQKNCIDLHRLCKQMHTKITSQFKAAEIGKNLFLLHRFKPLLAETSQCWPPLLVQRTV